MSRTTYPTRTPVGKCHQQHGPHRPARMKWIFQHNMRKARATHRNNPMMGILPKRRTKMQQQAAHQKLLPSGLSWPTVVATAVEFSPVGIAIHCASPPQPHDSTNEDANSSVVPRSLSSVLVADYFDTLQVQPPTPRKDFLGGGKK